MTPRQYYNYLNYSHMGVGITSHETGVDMLPMSVPENEVCAPGMSIPEDEFRRYTVESAFDGYIEF